MFSYSHRPDRDWMGNYPTAVAALTAGRARIGASTKVFVAELESAHYSDFLPAVEYLISMMRETVSEKLGDQHADVYDMLRPEDRTDLAARLENAVGEWEADLPADAAFTGVKVSTVVGYERLDEVRKSDFA